MLSFFFLLGWCKNVKIPFFGLLLMFFIAKVQKPFLGCVWANARKKSFFSGVFGHFCRAKTQILLSSEDAKL